MIAYLQLQRASRFAGVCGLAAASSNLCGGYWSMLSGKPTLMNGVSLMATDPPPHLTSEKVYTKK